MFNKPSVVLSFSLFPFWQNGTRVQLEVCPSGEATSEQPQGCLTEWPLHFCWLPQPYASPTWSPRYALLTVTTNVLVNPRRLVPSRLTCYKNPLNLQHIFLLTPDGLPVLSGSVAGSPGSHHTHLLCCVPYLLLGCTEVEFFQFQARNEVKPIYFLHSLQRLWSFYYLVTNFLLRVSNLRVFTEMITSAILLFALLQSSHFPGPEMYLLLA